MAYTDNNLACPLFDYADGSWGDNGNELVALAWVANTCETTGLLFDPYVSFFSFDTKRDCDFHSFKAVANPVFIYQH